MPRLGRVILTLVALTALNRPSVGASDPLPRVLILGDSVYQKPASGAASILEGRVEVVWRAINPGEVRNTTMALASLDRLLGDGKWDLIHFNFGLGDLVHRAPGMRKFRVLPRHVGGVLTTSPKDYEQNLDRLVRRLQATGAKLLWANTTPIRHTTSNVFENGSELENNAIAAKVMRAHGVPINDMHTYARNLIDMTRPASHGADPFHFDKKPLYPKVVRSILEELDLMRPVKGPVKVFVLVGGWTHIGGGVVIGAKSPRPGQNRGTLDDLVLNENTRANYRHLIDETGAWATRPDVWVQFDRRGPKSGALGIGYGGDRKRGIGPELAIGHVLGDRFDEQVCVLKTTLGSPSLAKDLRPPSSGKPGKSYTNLIKQIRESLSKLEDKFPDYTEESRYEIAGLVLQLGENDPEPAEFVTHLPRLINDLRTDLKAAELPVVLVGAGRGGRETPDFPRIIEAQKSVAALPSFRKTVAYVETRDFWPPENARDSWRHSSHERWYDNAESFYGIGIAVGEALVKLLEP